MKNTSEQSFRACPVCGNEERDALNVLITLENPRHVGLKSYDLLQCAVCELLYLSPLPSSEALEDIYITNTQFLDSDHYMGDRAKSALEFYAGRLRALQDRIAAKETPEKLLEIGSGLSWMSRAAKMTDRIWLTVAQDITAEAVQLCTWVDHYFVGSLDKQIEQISHLGPYHIISMTHVFEHLPDPVSVLASLQRILHPGGITFITAPYRPRRWDRDPSVENWKSWSYNHVPAHLQYYNLRSLELCAEKAGMKILSFDPSGDNGEAFEAWLTTR